MNTKTEKNLILYPSYYTIAGDIVPVGDIPPSPFSLKERIEAVSNAGFNGIAFQVDDLKVLRKKLTFGEIQTILKDYGLNYVDFELLTDWFTDEAVANQDRIKEIMESAASIGANTLKFAADLPPLEKDYSEDRYIDQLNVIGNLARDFNLTLNLEFMPFSSIPDVKTANFIIGKADHPHVKMLIDIWHVMRAGTPFSDIDDIPKELIGAVELGDGTIAAQESDLLADSYKNRTFPGLGEFDMSYFIKHIKGTGYEGPWGVEILSEQHRKLPLQEMCNRSYTSSMAFLS